MPTFVAPRHNSFQGIHPVSYLPTRHRILSRERLPLLPIFDNKESTSRTWGFFSGLKNIWSFEEKKKTISGSKSFLYRPDNALRPLPSNTEWFGQHSAPLRTNDVIQPQPGNSSNLVNSASYCNQRWHGPSSSEHLTTDAAVESVALQRARNLSTAVRRPKRSRVLPPPDPVKRNEEGHVEEVVRKRVRFSEEFLFPSDPRPPKPVQWSLPVRPRGYFLPFASWVAYHCNRMLTKDDNLHWIMTSEEETMVRDRIMSILRKYFPERRSVDGLQASTTSFLALWYMARLFPSGIFSHHDVRYIGGVEAVTRVFLLGLTLADKWLNDGAMHIREWQRFCSASPRASNLAEKLALSMLDYNIAISNIEWHHWLEALEHSTKYFGTGQLSAAEALHRARQEDRRRNFGIWSPTRYRDLVPCPALLRDLRECLLSESE
ncbi:hypothetical protein H0H92_004779 [Tricholoma furcatifolium]|nr:hypothetical protein H0H92_004779 [Tricholoma furcatifolium]